MYCVTAVLSSLPCTCVTWDAKNNPPSNFFGSFVDSNSPTTMGIIRISSRKRSPLWNFVPTSAVLWEVSILPTENCFFLTRSCTHRYRASTCFTRPLPVLAVIAWAAEESDITRSRTEKPNCIKASRNWMPEAAPRTMP